MQRYLIFTETDPNPVEAYLNSSGCTDIIIRKFSYGTELDFHCRTGVVLEQLEKFFLLTRTQELRDENTNPDKIRAIEIKAREDEITRKANLLISQERFWEAHTVIEDLWKSYRGRKREFYRGAILLAASMTHFQMGKERIAKIVYEKARSVLLFSGMASGLLNQVPEDFQYPVRFEVKIT